jgi:hypothetical protein
MSTSSPASASESVTGSVGAGKDKRCCREDIFYRVGTTGAMDENLRSVLQSGVIESRVMRMFVELCTQHRETPSVVPDVLDGWVLRSGDEWRFDASRAMEGGARTRTQYELFQEWRGSFMRCSTIGEEGMWRETLVHSGCDLPLYAGDEVPPARALSIAVSAENMRSAYRSFSLRGTRILPDRGGALEGLSRVLVEQEGVLRFEEGESGEPCVVLNGERYRPGASVSLGGQGGSAVLSKLFPTATQLYVTEIDAAAVWARSWEKVAAHLVWADLRHTLTRARLRES